MQMHERKSWRERERLDWTISPYSMNYIKKNVPIAVDKTGVHRTNYTSYLNMEQHKCMIYAQMHFNDKFFWFWSEIFIQFYIPYVRQYMRSS